MLVENRRLLLVATMLVVLLFLSKGEAKWWPFGKSKSAPSVGLCSELHPQINSSALKPDYHIVPNHKTGQLQLLATEPDGAPFHCCISEPPQGDRELQLFLSQSDKKNVAIGSLRALAGGYDMGYSGGEISAIVVPMEENGLLVRDGFVQISIEEVQKKAQPNSTHPVVQYSAPLQKVFCANGFVHVVNIKSAVDPHGHYRFAEARILSDSSIRNKLHARMAYLWIPEELLYTKKYFIHNETATASYQKSTAPNVKDAGKKKKPVEKCSQLPQITASFDDNIKRDLLSLRPHLEPNLKTRKLELRALAILDGYLRSLAAVLRGSPLHCRICHNETERELQFFFNYTYLEYDIGALQEPKPGEFLAIYNEGRMQDGSDSTYHLGPIDEIGLHVRDGLLLLPIIEKKSDGTSTLVQYSVPYQKCFCLITFRTKGANVVDISQASDPNGDKRFTRARLYSDTLTGGAHIWIPDELIQTDNRRNRDGE